MFPSLLQKKSSDGFQGDILGMQIIKQYLLIEEEEKRREKKLHIWRWKAVKQNAKQCSCLCKMSQREREGCKR